MAELTTLDGLPLYFDPAAVIAVADHDADTLEAVTTVYGLTSGRLRLAERPEAFLTRIGIAKSFARFTQLTDTFVWINCTTVVVIRTPRPDEHPPGAKAVVTAGSQTLVVKESPAQARQMVNAHGGNL